MKKYAVKDYYGNYYYVPISDELYEEMHILDNEYQRVYRAEVRHRSKIELDEAEHYIRRPYTSELEDNLIDDESENRLYEALKTLTPTQRRRVLLMIDNMSLWDMQEMEHRSYNALKESALAALKKIRRAMNG